MYYCDDCCDEHESEQDCPNTLYDCPECGAPDSVRIERGPAPEDPEEAYCDECNWEETHW